MASGPITSWQTDGETVTDFFFFFLGPKITADGDWSHEIKRYLLLGRKVMTNLDNILKSRDTTLPTKVRLVKVMVFPVVIYGCESWTIKKAEVWRIDDFELWCWRRLLRAPLTSRRSNQLMDFRMFCIYAFKSLKSIFTFDPVILTLKKLQRNSLDKTSQIWNLALTISLLHIIYVQSKEKILRFLLPPAKSETLEFRTTFFHSVLEVES